MNNTSNDVKQLLAKVSIYLARTVPPEKMAPELLKLLLPTLVNGTKERNTYVKANSEIALIAVLKLKEGDEMHQVRKIDIPFTITKLNLAEMFKYPGCWCQRITFRCCEQSFKENYAPTRYKRRGTGRNFISMIISM